MSIEKANRRVAQTGNWQQMSPNAEEGRVSSPRRRPLTEALIKAVNRKVPRDPKNRIFADLLVEALICKAMHGDPRTFRMILDIVEGPLPELRSESSPGERNRGGSPTLVLRQGDPAA